MYGIDTAGLDALVLGWLREDVGRGDHTTSATIDPEQQGVARIETRAPARVAGLGVAAACFRAAGGEALKWLPELEDGAEVRPGDVLARIEGSLRPILTAERTALNILARLTGIATFTASFVAAVEGTGASIVDTRKTTPGLRSLEKYAVTVGGGTNHRLGLDDGILVKDNHVMASGGVTEATRRAVAGRPYGLRVEVEVRDLDELEEAIQAGADLVLLDNMDPDRVAEAVARAEGRVRLEASGGISLENVRLYAQAGADHISVGALTHSAPAADMSLEVEI